VQLTGKQSDFDELKYNGDLFHAEEMLCCVPQTTEEVHESGTGRGVLMKVNPRGISSNS